jgi:hypothetical protein
LWETGRAVTESGEEEGRRCATETRRGGSEDRRGSGDQGGAVVTEEEGGGALPHGGRPVRQRRHQRTVERGRVPRTRLENKKMLLTTWVF